MKNSSAAFNNKPPRYQQQKEGNNLNAYDEYGAFSGSNSNSNRSARNNNGVSSPNISNFHSNNGGAYHSNFEYQNGNSGNKQQLSILFQDEKSEINTNPIDDQSSSMIELDNKLNEMQLFNAQNEHINNKQSNNGNRYGQQVNEQDYSSDDYCAMESSHSNSTLLSFHNHNQDFSKTNRNYQQQNSQIPTYLNQNNSKIKKPSIPNSLNQSTAYNSVVEKQPPQQQINTEATSSLNTSKNIKSNWLESTTSIKSCFLTGRGSTFGTQSHLNVHNAMDQVILKHHKAAQKQYLKMRSLRGGGGSNYSTFHSQTSQQQMLTTSNLSSHDQNMMMTNTHSSINHDTIGYKDIYSQRKQSIQSIQQQQPLNKPTKLTVNDHSRTNSHTNIVIDQITPSSYLQSTLQVSQTQKNENLTNFIFPEQKQLQSNSKNQMLTDDEGDHFRDTFNTVQSIVGGGLHGVGSRKGSLGQTSQFSQFTTRRLTEQKAFSLSRSNSRRPKEELAVHVNAQSNFQFKAKKPPQGTQKFIALKSTKALTIPQEVVLRTEIREISKQREQSVKEQTQREQSLNRISFCQKIQNQQHQYNTVNTDCDDNFFNDQQKNSQNNIHLDEKENQNCINTIKNSTQRLNSTSQQKMMNATSQISEVNTNKYLRNNIKKMKIGHNYAQLVNYAKSKFIH